MISNREGDDLAGRIRPKDGGFTYNTKTKQHYQGKGFAVAIPGNAERHPPGYDIARSHIQHYEQVHQNHLARKGAHLGGWHDPVTGDRSFDTSEIFTHRELGRAAMVSRGEDAMTNMSNYRSTRNKYKEAHAAGQISDEDHQLMRDAGASLLRHYQTP